MGLSRYYVQDITRPKSRCWVNWVFIWRHQESIHCQAHSDFSRIQVLAIFVLECLIFSLKQSTFLFMQPPPSSKSAMSVKSSHFESLWFPLLPSVLFSFSTISQRKLCFSNYICLDQAHWKSAYLRSNIL